MKTLIRHSKTFALISLLLTSLLPAETLWIEAESIFTDHPQANTGSAGSDLLSNGKVLGFNISKRQLEELLPEDGINLSYSFRTSENGEYVFWNRVVFENIRSPFQWRVNGGEWQQNSQENQPTINVQELAFWNPVGWTRMGTQTLSAGEHVLEIKIDKTVDEKNQPLDVRYISDALLISSDTDLLPNYGHKPGEEFEGQSLEPQPFVVEDKEEPRQAFELNGVWELAPYPEMEPIDNESRVSGVDSYPETAPLHWYEYSAPGGKNHQLPELRFAHRYILRKSVEIPESMEGHTFLMTFEMLNMINTLFVNGEKAGDFDIVEGQWQVDITEFIKAGQKNELMLVVKDTYYAMELKEGETRLQQYYPDSLFQNNQGITNRFDFPAANGHAESGLIDVARLEVVKGPVFVKDVFVKPYPVTKQSIEINTTLNSLDSTTKEVTVAYTVQSWPEGEIVMEGMEMGTTIGTRSELTLAIPSESLDLWWIYDAKLYELVSEVVVDGEVSDRMVTRFGNREWEVRGNQFYLNGVKQHLRSDLTGYGNMKGGAEAAVEAWKRLGINMFRRRFQDDWNGMRPRQTLAFLDEQGIPVRMNTGSFDGQVASYRLVDKTDQGRTARKDLFARWRAQILNGVQARKNHPSVFIWELDNELVYINARNFGLLDEVEPEFTQTSDEVMELDPTRVTVIGGGAALRDESLPTYGVHYFEVADRHYPNEAYTGEKAMERENSGTQGRVWPVDFDKKPIFFSETAFLPGRNPAGFAAVGGESAFLGKRQAKPAIGRIASWLAEGYRWKGFAAVHFWFSENFTDGSYSYAWQPVAVLRRQWGDTFGSGESVRRDLRVFNDLPDTRPITGEWSVELDGNIVASASKEFNVAPGTYEPWTIDFTLPETDTRKKGFLHLKASRMGEEVFHHPVAIELVPETNPSAVKVDGPLIVWDPEGSTTKRLEETGYTVDRQITSLEEIPDRFGLLVVGRNAVPAKDATSRRWMTLTGSGNKILFMEQAAPIHFQAVPADYSPTEYDGTIAFSQNLDHPIFAGVEQADLDFWGADEVVYRNAVRKPSRGAASLVQVDDALGFSALLTVKVDEGLNVINQLAIAEKLDESVTARTLFDNMVRYAATYQPVYRSLTAVVSDPFFRETLESTGVNLTFSEDPVKALQENPEGILLVEGTTENLTSLTSNIDLVEKTFESGGWIFVQNVTPESLETFNKLVGVDHLIRPFRQERVRFPAVRDPVSSGLTQTDVVMSSGKRIQRHNRDEWPTDDAFSYILDLEDMAPFAEFPSPGYWNDPQTTGPGSDTWPLNMVNGYGSDTHWRMVFSIHLQNGDPTEWVMTLPREEKVSEIRIQPNRIYHLIKGYEVTFNGDPSTTTAFEVDPGEELQVLNFEEPVSAKEISLSITDWEESGRSDVIGIDILEILVERDVENGVKPVLNIGGLIRYPRGEGGVLLSQYVFREQESNPINYNKKKNVTSTLLANLGASFGGQNTVIAGHNLKYEPVSLEDFANLYLTKEQGWPAREGDLSAIPKGENTFAGVRYEIRDFSTSPLESAVTLKHPRFKSNADADRVNNIPLGFKADSLFFLHTFLEQRRWKPNKRDNEAPELFVYTVAYEDGSKETIPVVLTKQVESWLQDEPKSLIGAEVAWAGKLDGGKENATVYQMQWNNPHPGKILKSISLTFGEDGNRWGAPVLLGITGAKVVE